MSENEKVEFGLKINQDADAEHSNQAFNRTLVAYHRKMFKTCTGVCLKEFNIKELSTREKTCLENCVVTFAKTQTIIMNAILDEAKNKV